MKNTILGIFYYSILFFIVSIIYSYSLCRQNIIYLHFSGFILVSQFHNSSLHDLCLYISIIQRNTFYSFHKRLTFKYQSLFLVKCWLLNRLFKLILLMHAPIINKEIKKHCKINTRANLHEQSFVNCA